MNSTNKTFSKLMMCIHQSVGLHYLHAYDWLTTGWTYSTTVNRCEMLSNSPFIGFCHEPKHDDCGHRFEENKAVMAERENLTAKMKANIQRIDDEAWVRKSSL